MRLAATLFLTPIFIIAVEVPSTVSLPSENRLTYSPWLTGPLLSPTPINMQSGRPAIEPALTIANTYGNYNAKWQLKKEDPTWGINPMIDFQFGITDKFGVETLISFISSFKNEKTASYFQDTNILCGYQVSNDVEESWVPDCRLILQGTFPTGKYQRLDPDKEKIDSTGAGAFQTGPILVVRKLFYLPQNLFIKGSIGYLFPSTINIEGFNAYGGGYGTKGKVKPGQTLTAFLSGECSINQRWALTLDAEFLYRKKSHFKGKSGLDAKGAIPQTTLPNSMQISFAPEVEYSFSSLSGVLAGAWFTVAGKNSAAFASAFLAYLHVF